MSIRNDLLEDILTAIQGGGGGAAVNRVNLLTGRSVSPAQNPSGLDNPLQIEFGPAQGGALDVAQLDVNGGLKVNESGVYYITITLQTGRTGGAGTSLLFGRILVNGAQMGGSVSAELQNSNIIIPLQFDVFFPLPAGAVVTVELYRDSSGNNSGGLIESVPTLVDWEHAETATIQVSRLEVTP